MYYGARWYDVALGRFVQADTIVPEQTQGTQAWDRYAGMNNNPVRYSDPTGHDVCDEEGNCYNESGQYRAPIRLGTPNARQLTGVPLVDQGNTTYCGQAAFTMAWNYAHPNEKLNFSDVAQASDKAEWHTPGSPYTSSESMEDMANSFGNATVQNLTNETDAKKYIFDQLTGYKPVVADVTTTMGISSGSEAHFVVVTGIDFENGTVTYNDPFGWNLGGSHKAETRTVDWNVFWDAWQNNDDKSPGWSMTIQ